MVDEIEVVGAEAAEAALASLIRKLTAEAPADLADYASEQERRVRAAADTRQARMVARGISAARSREGGTVEAAGGGTLPTGRGTYADVFWGAEFGGSQPQFRSWNPTGYWFFPTIDAANDADLERIGEQLLDQAARRWAD